MSNNCRWYFSYFWFVIAVLLLVLLSNNNNNNTYTFVYGQLCTGGGDAADDSKQCDTHERCSVWREEGECIKNRSYMMKYCPASCAAEDIATKFNDNNNNNSGCIDKHKFCPTWAELGECEESKHDMNLYCPKSCGVCGDDSIVKKLLKTLSSQVDAITGSSKCTNEHENCDFWADAGECDNNPNYMLKKCQKACNVCSSNNKRQLNDDADGDDDDGAEVVDEDDESSSNNSVYNELKKQSVQFGVKQTISGDKSEQVAKVIQESIHYFNDPKTKQLPSKILKECQNRNNLCAFWAVIGECEENPAYMTTNCAPSCKTCNLIDIEARCPKLDDAKPALYPGDLNKLFYRIIQSAPGNRTDLTDEERRQLTESKTPLYTVHVHSRPGNDTVTEVSVPMDKSLPPWVVTFENFVTEEECEELIKLGHKYEYKRSEDVGAMKFDGTYDGIKSSSRTSENAWCSDNTGCRKEEVPVRVQQRIANVLGIPPENSEDLQILKYELNQFYRTHHDYIPSQADRQCGPRILTFFLYLSDVEEGGGTNFPTLDITVMPKRGKALLWPSVLNASPYKWDPRTDHQALPVKKGIKYAANGWIHMFDYITPNNKGCT